MSLGGFLRGLFEAGRVEVPRVAPLDDVDLAEAGRRLEAFERLYRRQLAGTPPAYAPAPALWAATVFYRCCQFLVYRESGADALDDAFLPPCPDGASPSAHYSADLTFRCLPDLVRFARAASHDDPLVKYLNQLAASWPLSSVGISNVVNDSQTVDVAPILSSRCLLTLYIDRIIARDDVSRLADPRIRDAVAGAVGLFPELAPKMAPVLGLEEVGRVSDPCDDAPYGFESVLRATEDL